MSKQYICEGCSKSCRSGVTHKCSEACTECLSIPPCISMNVRIPCGSCNRTFRSQACFEKHKTHMLKGKPVCVQKRNCGKYNSPISPMRKHVCFKQYCSFCQQKREAGNFCYMRPLKNEFPRSDNVLSVLRLRNDTRHVANSPQLYTSLILYAFNISAHSVRRRLILTWTV